MDADLGRTEVGGQRTEVRGRSADYADYADYTDYTDYTDWKMLIM